MRDRKRLFILGAGGFGRELESWLCMLNEKERDWDIFGYLDKNREALKGFRSDYKIVGEEDSFSFKSDDLVIIATADTCLKEKLYSKLRGKVHFYTFVSNNAVIGKFNNIGEGSVICPNCVVSANVTIGKLVTINCGTQIGHNAQIDDFSSLMSNVDIGGEVQIGKKTYIGLNATILPRKKICDNAKIGIGSIVIRDVKDTKTVFGNPAKTI